MHPCPPRSTLFPYTTLFRSGDVGFDLIGLRLPALRQVEVAVQLGEASAAIARHPAHELRRGEMLGLTPYLPDAAVGLPPVLDGRFDTALEDRPHDLRQVVPGFGVQVHGVQDRTPNVVLLLGVGGVAGARRLRPLFPTE